MEVRGDSDRKRTRNKFGPLNFFQIYIYIFDKCKHGGAEFLSAGVRRSIAPPALPLR